MHHPPPTMKRSNGLEASNGMAWAEPQFSISDVNWAGAVLRSSQFDVLDLSRALTIINNWRAAHAYPLNTFQITLRNRARKCQAEPPLVSQRLKRLVSIDAKLRRYRTMNLAQIQDIAGCRTVMRSAAGALKLAEVYRNGDFDHTLQTDKDYIAAPKPDGYRGVHLVYRYGGHDQTACYKGLRVEVQLRSRLQHAWATAVETAGTFTGHALKSNQGSEEWLRFFTLMGTAIARIEKQPDVPGTPRSQKDLRGELTEIERRLGVVQVLRTYRTTLGDVSRARDAKYFLIQLDPLDQVVRVETFAASQSQDASELYTRLEAELPEGSMRQVVLVSVESIQALKRAYPNYFLDTDVFVGVVKRVLSGA